MAKIANVYGRVMIHYHAANFVGGVAWARIEFINQDTGDSYVKSTGEAGWYYLLSIPEGKYLVHANYGHHSGVPFEYTVTRGNAPLDVIIELPF